MCTQAPPCTTSFKRVNMKGRVCIFPKSRNRSRPASVESLGYLDVAGTREHAEDDDTTAHSYQNVSIRSTNGSHGSMCRLVPPIGYFALSLWLRRVQSNLTNDACCGLFSSSPTTAWLNSLHALPFSCTVEIAMRVSKALDVLMYPGQKVTCSYMCRIIVPG